MTAIKTNMTIAAIVDASAESETNRKAAIKEARRRLARRKANKQPRAYLINAIEQMGGTISPCQTAQRAKEGASKAKYLSKKAERLNAAPVKAPKQGSLKLAPAPEVIERIVEVPVEVIKVKTVVRTSWAAIVLTALSSATATAGIIYLMNG